MNYINNQDLYNSMVEWKKSNDDKLPKTVVDAIMQICHNLAKSGKFCRYTWKEDMIQDALYDCVKGAKTFNPEKSKNPFAYFTQIAYNAFRRYLNNEHLRLATIEEYKQTIDTLYHVDHDEDCDSITDNAKMTDIQYQKRYHIKKQKSVKPRVDMDAMF